jgi:hypothetical protein
MAASSEYPETYSTRRSGTQPPGTRRSGPDRMIRLERSARPQIAQRLRGVRVQLAIEPNRGLGAERVHMPDGVTRHVRRRTHL